MSREAFKLVVRDDNYAYTYFEIKSTKRGHFPVSAMLDDPDIPIDIKARAERFMYRDYIEVKERLYMV